ncbi:MAG: PTS sugar transporter subunit IIA [bacterium]
MILTSFLPKEAMSAQLEGKTGSEVLKELAVLLSKADPSLSVEEIRAVLEEREKLGSTGIGSGVAIPHGKLASARKIVACFGRSPEGIDFQSQDGEPAHLFFALIAPENAAGLHLKVLAKLSRLLKDRSFREALLKAQNADEIFEILSKEDDKM